MTAYICKCGQRVQKSGSADNTGNRLEGYGPGHECYGCPYAMPWGGNKWDEAAKRFVQDIKGYECRTSRTLSYDSHFIGSTKDKCTCAVVSLDFDFLEQISAWVKDTFPLGELTGGFSQDEIRPTDYSHNGRYCCTFVCASNKKGIAAKAALFARFFDPDGSRKDMTPQQEREKILADIRKCTQEPPAAEDVAVAALPPAEAAEPFVNIPAAPSFDFSALGDLSQQAADADQQFDLHYGAAQDEYLISCIYLARIHALTAKAGRYGGGTWTKWYESKGLSEGSARTMARYKIYDNKSDVITPVGEKLTAEQWLDRYQWGRYTKMIVGGGIINGSVALVFDDEVERYRKAGCDFSACTTDEDYLAAIEAFEDNPPMADAGVSDQTRIADALEDMVALSLPDAE